MATTLSLGQDRVLSILGMASATLSFFGSGLIVLRVWHKREFNMTSYDRIMGAFSSCQLVASFSYGMGPLMLPRDSSQRAWALGNDTTCSVLGFLTQFGFSAVW